MTNNIFNRPEYQSLMREYDTMAQLDTSRGDKFAVKNGVLEISKGGFLQAPTRTVKNVLHGGYNRDAVVKHLAELEKKTIQLMRDIFSDPANIRNSPLEVKQLQKKIRAVATALSDIEGAYRDEMAIKDDTPKKLSALYDRFSNINKNLKAILKHVEMPEQPRPPIDFDAPVNLRKMKVTSMPKGQTPEDVLRLAKSAEKQIVPVWKKVGLVALTVLAMAVLVWPLTYLQALKYVIWNPIEFIARGKVTSDNPIIYWSKNMGSIWSKYLNNDPQKALEIYALQLVRAPVISEQHVAAFTKLAHHVKEVDLFNTAVASNKLEDLLSMLKENSDEHEINDYNFGKNAQETMSQMLDGLDGKLMTVREFEMFLRCHHEQLRWIDDPAYVPRYRIQEFVQWKAQFQGNERNAEERKAYFIQTNSIVEGIERRSKLQKLISPQNLLKVIEAIGKNPRCKKFEMGQYSHNLPEVNAALKKHGFKQNDANYRWIYTRK